MIVIPVSADPDTYFLFFLLEEENLERMKRADPSAFKMPPSPEFAHKRLKEIFLCHINAEEKKHLLTLMQAEDIQGIARYLMRGWEFRPDLGDYDGPPLSLRTKGETKQ